MADLLSGVGNPAGNAAFTSPVQITFEDQALGIYTATTVHGISFTAVNAHLRIDDDYQIYNQTGIYLDNGTSSYQGFSTLRIDFAHATDAFAFTWGMADIGTYWTLNAYDAQANLLDSQNLPGTGSSSQGEYYGIQTPDISYAMLQRSGAYDWVAIDNFTYNNDIAPVPEPATLLLLGSGLIIGSAGLGKRLRKD